MGKRYVLLGLTGLALAFWGLWRDIGAIAQPFYAWAWWSYILFLDGIVFLRRGSSLLTTRRRHVPTILLWSVTFWYFFELLNLRFQNWYYVGVFETSSEVFLLAAALFGVACFATVFMGLFETYEVLTSFGIFGGAKLRERRFSRWVSYAVQALGAFMVVLAVSFPLYLAPLVWGSLSFLLDPWNYRRGARSILADVERGDVGGLLRLLVAGLACGLVWESFNFFAPQKWIYTVRGLEGLKLFEMPLLGFLGFPALALDAFAAYAAVAFQFHRNETWENPNDVKQGLAPTEPLTRKLVLLLLPLHFFFWGGVALLTERVSIGSVTLRLEHLETLPEESIAALEEHGIHRPRQLLAALDEPEVQSRLELTGAGVEALRREAELLTLKGIGVHHGQLLRRVGIRSRADLARADPDELYERLSSEREPGSFPALRPGMVRVWVRAAQQ